MINPEIIRKEGAQSGEEGCLSIPGFRETGDARQKCDGEGAGCQGRVVRDDRRGSAGPRVPA